VPRTSVLSEGWILTDLAESASALTRSPSVSSIVAPRVKYERGRGKACSSQTEKISDFEFYLRCFHDWHQNIIRSRELVRE